MRSEIVSGFVLVVLAAFAGCGGSTDEGENGNPSSVSGGGGSAGMSGGSGGVAGVGNTTSGGGGYTCFAAGTPIATPRGEVPIDQLSVGDLVLAYDEAAHAVVSRPVVRTFAHPDQRPGHLRLEDGRVLEVTDNHPIYLPDRAKYASAGTVARNTRLLLLNGASTTSGIADGFLADPGVALQTVYNIEVAELHNYFAGDVLVHNKSGGAPPCNYEKKQVSGTDACDVGTGCLDPNPASFEDIDGGAPDPDAGAGGAQELQRWFCSQPDPNQTYLVAFDLSSPEPYEDYISLVTSPMFDAGTGGGANCSGFELGQIWTWHEADAATTNWTTLCTAVPGAQLNEHLAARVESANAKLRNLRFVKSCDCHLTQKKWNSCSNSYEGFAGASSCE